MLCWHFACFSFRCFALTFAHKLCACCVRWRLRYRRLVSQHRSVRCYVRVIVSETSWFVVRSACTSANGYVNASAHTCVPCPSGPLSVVCSLFFVLVRFVMFGCTGTVYPQALVNTLINTGGVTSCICNGGYQKAADHIHCTRTFVCASLVLIIVDRCLLPVCPTGKFSLLGSLQCVNCSAGV